MGETAIFRTQHDDLLEIVTRISKYLAVEKLSDNTNEVRSLLSKLIGKLNVHLTREIRSFEKNKNFQEYQ